MPVLEVEIPISTRIIEGTDLRWPIPVICRDVNYSHQSETRLMYPDDIVPFLQDELYGLEWSHDRLEKALETIYETGKGHLDPAALVIGESWLDHTHMYGFADALGEPVRKYSFLAPVSSPSAVDLVDEFLDMAQGSDANASQARHMMQTVDRMLARPPAVTLVLDE